METYRADAMRAAGVDETFVQDNHSRSSRGVLRGLHYQLRPPSGQVMSCRAWRGARRSSGYSRRVTALWQVGGCGALGGEQAHALYLPKGFAHGFVVRSETADFLYKCSEYYDADDDGGVLWNDPALGIEWDTPSPILSAKDAAFLPLAQIARERLPLYQP